MDSCFQAGVDALEDVAIMADCHVNNLHLLGLHPDLAWVISACLVAYPLCMPLPEYIICHGCRFGLSNVLADPGP